MPDFQDSLDRFYTKLAQIYLKDDARQSGYQSTWWFRRVVNVIKTELKIHKIYSETIVDLGCGSGLFLKHVFPKHKNLIGVDFNELACERALQRGINAIRADIFNLPFKEQSLTNICCINVLQQFSFDDISHFIKSSASILRQDGIFILVWRNDECVLHKLARLVYSLSFKKNKSFSWYGHSLHDIVTLLSVNRIGILSACAISAVLGTRLRSSSPISRLLGAEFFVVAVKQ